MFRGNLTHSAISPETSINTTNASTLTAGWTASVASASYSSPAVVNLKALGEPVVFVGGVGTLAAYPATGGTPLWTFPVNKMVAASPAYGKDANGTPVITFGTDDPDNSVYALKANSGAMLWTYRTNNTIANDDVGAPSTISAPGVNGFADGVVYITGKDKITYALNLATGVALWTQQPDTAGYWASPTISQGTIYVTGNDGQLLTFAPTAH